MQSVTIPTDFRDVPVHMVGIGGSGMAGLAAILLRRGARLSGTDHQASLEIAQLAAAGAAILTEQTADAIPDDAQLLVTSAAIQPDHPEVIAAGRRGIPVLKYAQMLGALLATGDGIAVSGTHGKSTTSAWLTYVLKHSGLDPSFIIGAKVPQLGGGSGVGDGAHFVAEACEYDRSFLNLTPQRIAILNVEEDHLDYYEDLTEIRAAFLEFARRVPPNGLIVLNGDDPQCRRIAQHLPHRVESFGESRDCDWQASDIEIEDGRYRFDVRLDGHNLGRIHLGLPGLHNVHNALAVVALAHDCGIPWPTIQEHLPQFRGVGRRLEERGFARGVFVLDDYAHHPTEIRATLRAARERYRPSRLTVVFQPHQHSRTRFLLNDFARSFADADSVIVPDIFFVRDSERDRQAVCAGDLVGRINERGGQATYISSFDDIVERLAETVSSGDVILTMGAGNVWNVADRLLQRLRTGLPA